MKNLVMLFALAMPLCVNSSVIDHKFELGRFLFFDKIISGNKNISCATCHHPLTGTSDSLALPVGEGGIGLGKSRSFGDGNNKVHQRVPRNSPALFNLDPDIISVIFQDGRIERSNKYPSGFISPAKFDLPHDLENIFAAQSLFPLQALDEMAGQKGENSIANAAIEKDLVKVWDIVLKRLLSFPEYIQMFLRAYPELQDKSEIKISHFANAIAHFEIKAFKTLNSPFDNYMQGDDDAISESAKRGYELFKGKAKCATCHSGNLFTDNDFHSIAFPQVGPGKGVGFGKREDYGREIFTLDRKDRYKFRTTPLRNVAVTGPYGHSGAYNSLMDVINHHENPRMMLLNYDRKQLRVNEDEDFYDFTVMDAKGILELILRSSDLPNIKLNLKEKKDIENFLHSLTDRACLDMGHLIPKSVPSKLPIYE